MEHDPDDEASDLRDAIFDARSVDDLRRGVGAVGDFWRKRGSGANAAIVTRFLDRMEFGETPPAVVLTELRATLSGIAETDPRARAYLGALRE